MSTIVSQSNKPGKKASSSLPAVTLIYGASQIVQVTSSGDRFIRGNWTEKVKNLAILTKKEEKEKNDPLCIVSIGGIIKFVGYQSDPRYTRDFANLEFTEKIDASGMCVLPGLVDAHTHPVWAGDRVEEFAMKLEGATYMQIHARGGGIHSTVNATRQSSEQALYESLERRLARFLSTGTTFVECKSGYGLDWPTERKMLTVITRAKRNKVPGISSTYLGAHAVPKNSTAGQATDAIVTKHLPALRKLVDEGTLDVDNVDVFCEKGVFDVAQTERIFNASRPFFQLNFHADELTALNSVEMAVRVGAKAANHLEEISDHEIKLMAESETVGVLLPTTAMILQLKRPPARKMLESGCIVALGSDFNPNAHASSMPLIMSLACVDLRLSMNEALIASTLNAAFSLGVSNTRGSIEEGKRADLILVKTNRWENLIYQLGSHTNLIKHVLVNGKIEFTNKNIMG